MTASPAAVLEHRAPHDRTHGGRLVVERLPQLVRHRGTGPDLVLRWGSMPRAATVDVVVHLHGFSARGARMTLPDDKERRSGLDLSDPANPATRGRRTPTLLVLPRGHFHGGRRYSFPALTAPGALARLVDDALRRFSAATGVHATRGKLILTAHSGGGSALMAILRHADPDEVHAFDALYTDPAPLIAWARKRKAAGTGALRVLFRPGEGTAANSLRVAAALAPGSRTFRVERTRVAHDDIPRIFGWRLLADPGTDLPEAGGHGGPEHEAPSPGGPAQPLCEAIAKVAREQFRRWRPGRGAALTETDAAASALLREYYREGVGVTVSDAQLRSKAYQAGHPWSAVFVSYVMRRAGAGPAFRYSAAHQSYIRAARANRLRGDTANPFWAFRATEAVPRVGDLVCAARQDSGATYDNIGDARYRATHCDVVTDVRPGRIRVIGGNVGQTVGQTVGEKSLRTRPDGKLDLTGPQSRFFAVITCRRDGRHLPPAASTVPTGQDARIRRVMDLLVNTYHYPVNGAAGVVGNLIAESGVQPDRIEGSREDTPMRSADFTGRVRDFTPDEVRDRSTTARTGPRLPGIGLAQWTSANRRAGLFRHGFRGRVPGSAILSDLDAQVDYLVTELRGDYAAVDAVLRSPGVTADQAADVVVLKFERPAAVLDRPVGDPGVQEVLARRRAHAARALALHRSR
ncbi:phage tail tip lysozyme [Amycolatopsis solani]|uniref:phage tail tip lysozyme n=1 Tax=Amycolatopsis solani TaxID=3028615 RepID=UPI0025B11B18|nr:phage tail tip lysozyme [Amycolatopsis sp. MEP2-6]